MSLFDKHTISSISNIYLFYSFWLLYTLQNACLDSFLETFLRLFWNLTSRGALIVKSERKEHLRNSKPDNWGNIYKKVMWWYNWKTGTFRYWPYFATVNTKTSSLIGPIKKSASNQWSSRVQRFRKSFQKTSNRNWPLKLLHWTPLWENLTENTLSFGHYPNWGGGALQPMWLWNFLNS